jgi:hypothetical protein
MAYSKGAVPAADILGITYSKGAPKLATLKGTVRGIMGMLVSGALVTLDDKTTYTAPDGTFEFTELPLRTYDLSIKHWLYNLYTERIPIIVAQTYTKDITMSPNLLILAAMGTGALTFIGATAWAVSK